MRKIVEALQSNRFQVENLMATDRSGNYERQTKIASKWFVLNETRSAPAKLEFFLRYKNEFALLDNYEAAERFEGLTISMVIGAPLGFYRLMCIFRRAPLVVPQIYKQLVAFSLMHQRTESYLEFTDYKGAFGIAARFTQTPQLPREFKTDLLELLNFMISNEAAHPYDKTVAGFVA